MNNQKGFSLIEILVAVTLMSIMTVAVAPQLKYMLNFESGADTKNKLSELSSGFATAYLANIAQIEQDPNAEINFGSAGIMHPATTTAGGRCTATSANFLPWSEYSGQAPATMVKDGYGAPICILINPQSSVMVNGVTLYYHTVAFVSAGPNNVFDNGTALSATGTLTLGNDDTGVLFDGRAFSVEKYNTTADKMKIIASALEQYYVTRYQSDPSRSSSIDYWSNGAGLTATAAARWDSSNPGNVIDYTPAATPMYSTGASTELSVALSLSKADVTDGFGSIINFENASPYVRSPANSNANQSIPPYTSLISTTLPGGVTYSDAVVGVNN